MLRPSAALFVLSIALWTGSVAAQGMMRPLDAGSAALDGGMPAEAQDAGDAGDAQSYDAGLEDAEIATEPEPEQEVEAIAPPLTVLPPAPFDPEIAPIMVGREAVSEQVAPIAREDRPLVAIATLLGLLALIALAYLGGHPKVQAAERRLGVSQVITAGFPFVLLGLAARHESVGLLDDALLAELSPLLRIGLGAIGFVAGFRFGAQFRTAPGEQAVRVAAWVTLVPFALVALVSGGLLLLLASNVSASALRDPVFIRDAIILGTAGAMTARSSAELFRAEDVERLLARVLRLEELAGIVGLALVAAYFRPLGDASWHLPGMAWLLLTIGFGATLGLISYFLFRRPQEGPEFVLLTLGSIGFGAGVAGYLRLSPVVVTFIAGSCLIALPVANRERIRSALRRLERPVYSLSLIVIGALWKIDDWQGWVLIPVFTGARLFGKWLGTGGAARFAGVDLSRHERQVLAVSPMGPLAIAIVVNAQLLYPGGSISRIVAAVIGGAIVTEVIVQLASRRVLVNDGSDPPAGRTSNAALSEPPEPTP